MEAAETLAVARARPALTLGRAILLVGILLAIAVPFAAKSFLVFQLTLVLVYAIAICGLNLLTGFNGQFSLGHGAFYAIGAYTAAILMEHGGVSYVWTIPAAGLVCFVAGFLFGLPALRLEAIYLALATFALAVAAPQILKLSPLEHWTGGVQGIVILKPDAPFGLPLNQDQWLYFFTLGVALAMFFAAHNLVHSRTGRAIMAIRDNPIAARSMGINTALYKTLTFGVSALYTGVAGALGAIVVAVRRPGQLHLLALDRLPGRARRRRRRLDPGRALRRRLRALRPEHRRAHLERAVERRLWRDPDFADLFDALGRRGLLSASREPRREMAAPTQGGKDMKAFVHRYGVAVAAATVRRASSSLRSRPRRRRNTIRARATPRSRSATSTPTAARPRPTASSARPSRPTSRR